MLGIRLWVGFGDGVDRTDRPTAAGQGPALPGRSGGDVHSEGAEGRVQPEARSRTTVGVEADHVFRGRD